MSALQGKDSVLILSIMSNHTRNEITKYFNLGKVTIPELHILTLSPDISDDVIRALSKHIGEEPENNKNQILNAWKGWKELEKKFPKKITVYEYSSIPTLQGVLCRNKAINIEILTYQTSPYDRSSIFLDSQGYPKAFEFFADTLEKLWKDAEFEAKSNNK